jgi:hypothetical protein
MIIKNTGYTPGLALGRRKVSSVSYGRLLELLRHEDLLLVLFDDILIVWLLRDHVLNYLVIYTYEMTT